MRERYQIVNRTVCLDLPAAADNVNQGVESKKLGDCEFTHWKNQAGLENFELSPQPIRTCQNFFFVRDAISAFWIFSWKTATYGGEVNPTTRRIFIPTGCELKPAKECLTGCPREWPAKLWFFDAWRLPNEEDLALHWPADNDGLVHGGAPSATGELLEVSL